MKNLKKIISVTMMAVLILCNSSITYAAANKSVDTNNILLKIGYSPEIADVMSQEDSKEITEAYIKNPDRVSYSSSVLEVDVLSEMETYVNTTHDEKLKMGLTEEQIKKTDGEINNFLGKSDSQLKKDYNIDDTTIKLMRKALQPNNDYSVKDVYPDVTASGSVTQSEMNIGQSVVDYSTSSKKNYSVFSTFYWNDWYFWACFNDKLVTAWGGNLTQSVSNSSIGYDSQNDSGVWGSYSTTKTASYVESSINAGGYYSWPQGLYDSVGSKARYGSISYKLSQNSAGNKTTKILSQYAHQTLSLTGSGISVSASGPSVTITIGTAYDKSPQCEDIITY